MGTITFLPKAPTLAPILQGYAAVEPKRWIILLDEKATFARPSLPLPDIT